MRNPHVGPQTTFTSMLFKLLNVHLNNFDSNLSFLKQRITAQTQFDKQIPKKCSISQL